VNSIKIKGAVIKINCAFYYGSNYRGFNEFMEQKLENLINYLKMI
jgi:hypothetical protein